MIYKAFRDSDFFLVRIGLLDKSSNVFRLETGHHVQKAKRRIHYLLSEPAALLDSGAANSQRSTFNNRRDTLMENGYMMLNGVKYPMECSWMELNGKKNVDETLKAIKERQKLKKELEKRSSELRAQADLIRHSDLYKARLLEHRGIALADEAYRIRKENKQGLSTAQIRRSVALANLALLKDGETK